MENNNKIWNGFTVPFLRNDMLSNFLFYLVGQIKNNKFKGPLRFCVFLSVEGGVIVIIVVVIVVNSNNNKNNNNNNSLITYIDCIGCMLAACIYGCHPVHAEVIGWASAQPYALASLFFHLSILYYLKNM